jgi:hypothetical protein
MSSGSENYQSMDYGVAIVGSVVTVGVAIAGALVLVAEVPPTTMMTYTSSPKNCPPAVDMRQLPRCVPVVAGATIGTDRSNCAPAGTEVASVSVELPIASPPVRENLKPASQAHVPAFNTFQVFVKVCPAVICVLSGIVTSLTNLRL